MKILIILAIIGIAIADASDVSDMEVTTNDNENDGTLTGSSEDRQPTRPVFPKSVIEFILTTESTTDTIVNKYKKPVFKIVEKAVKMKHNSYWKSATRRPSLMKHTKFTVDPLSFNKHRYSENAKKQSNEEIQRKHDVDQFRKTMSSNKDDSSEESSETTENEKRKDKTKHVKTLIRRFHKLRSKINREKNRENISKFKESVTLNMNMNTDVNTIKPNVNEFTSQDKEDRQEFIFVTPKIQEQAIKVEEDSEEADETTTLTLEKELKRQKRSINVIEEENLGTTVSGFKFTGKVNSMNSNLIFSNINT